LRTCEPALNDAIWTPENPLLPIGANEAAGMTPPSSVIEPSAASGAMTLTYCPEYPAGLITT
jgi:hypothetical protein